MDEHALRNNHMRRALRNLLFSLPLASSAQNLVVNPSFEDYTTCPNDISQIDLVFGWTNLFISPDYFNACADDTASVPFNALGNQLPSDGNGYAGIGTYPAGGQEYLQGELMEALEPGVLTYVSMRVAPGGFGYATWTSPRLASSHVGLRFSTEPLDFLTAYGALHFNNAVLYLPTVLDDTSAWTVLSTSYIPDSAYRYLQIGTFFNDGLVGWSVLDANGDWDVAYSFVDQVCVSKVIGECDPIASMHGEAFPLRPSALVINHSLELPIGAWGLDGVVEQLCLFDSRGRLVEQMETPGHAGTIVWPLEQIVPGAYLLRLQLRGRPSLVIRSWKL